MKYRNNQNSNNQNLYKQLKIDCSECFGFCCVALYFSTMDGFPKDKVAGEPCINLEENFTCKIHKDLIKEGLKGCTSFDCFGAGQKVAKYTYKNRSWKDDKEKSKEMYDTFVAMKNLHEMIWYLNDSMTFTENKNLFNKIEKMINKTKELTNLTGKDILNINIQKHREEVNFLLKESRKDFLGRINPQKKEDKPLGFDFIGKDLSKRNLKNTNMAGTLLIGANLKNLDLSGTMLIGADMRDADIRGANLKDAMFITQSQINTARGDSKTKLPKNIIRPSYWVK